MLRDELLTLCDKYSVATKTTAANVTNVIDFGETASIPGANKRGGGYLNIQVTSTITGGTAPALTIVDSADNSSFAQVAGTGTISLASLTAGTVISIPLPKVRRYFTVKYGATAAATGAFTAWVGDKATQH